MKLRYIIATIAAAFTLAVGCEKEADHFLEEIQVTSSYISFPAEGGSTEIEYKAIDSWTISGLPDFITASPASGGQGLGTIKFTATAATETREGTFTIDCAGKSQTITYIQVTEKVEPKLTSMADVIAAGAGTFRIRGTVIKITNPGYGNWWINDGTVEGDGIQIYGTLDKKGNTWDKNPDHNNLNCPTNPNAWEFAPGDILTVEGPYSLYGTTHELVDVTVIEIERSLIGVNSIHLLGDPEGEGKNEFPLEGGSISVVLDIKGEGFHVNIPEDAKSWLHIEDFGPDYVVLSADPNAGGDRKTTVTFTTDKDGETYSCSQEFIQKGAILEVSIADFLAAPVGETQFRLTGVITEVANPSYGNVYLRDWSGTTYVYGIGAKGDFEKLGLGAGDVVTLLGKRGEYNGNAQMAGSVCEKQIITVKDKKLSEIGAAADDANVYYIATGTLKEIVNPTYGNVWLSDDSGDLYVYGCYPGWGASGDNRKNFLEAAGIKVGDKLSVIGVKSTYNDAPQISNGIYFNHEEGEAPVEEEVSLFLNEFETQNKKIEIYNAGDKEVDMTGWTLSKDETVWTIPAEHAKVPAKGFIVYTGKSDGTTDPTFGLSGTKGFVVVLADKNGKEIDKVDNSSNREGGIVQIEDGKSWGRETDGAANFVIFDTPTIGASNGAAAPVENFDYTPGAAYSAANNLWKPVDDAKAAKFFMYMNTAADWSNAKYDNVSTTDCPYCELKQSTYRLSLEDQTFDRWQNQFYIFPGDESKFIPLDKAKKYKFSVTLQSTTAFGAFFKLSKYDPNNNAQGKYEGEAIWEAPGYPVNINFEAGKPVVMEQEFEGVEAPNINLIFDFGGNPAGTVVYIKDITIAEAAAEAPALSIADIINAEKGAEVKSNECQVMAITQRGFVASDGNKAIYVYTQGSDFNGKVGLGDKIKFTGSKTTYNGVPEVEKVSALEILSINNTITYPQSTDVTADALTYKATEAEYISFTGTLALSGNYYNVELEGIDKDKKMGSLVYPADYLKAKNYDGKKIKVTGYYNGLSGSDKYLNVIATSIDEPGAAPAASITIDGDMSDWANIEGTVLTPTGEEGVEGAQAIAEVKGFVDDTNVYVYVKRVKLGRWTKLWGGDDGNAGYYYYDFDMDNNPETGDYAENSHGNYECWTYLYIFGGTADAPVFRATPPGSAKGMTIDNVNCNGVVTADAIETEISFPLADLATITSDTISVTVWGNKDGNPLVKATFPAK